MSTCKIFGYIDDGAGEPVEGLLVQFIPQEPVAVFSSTGRAIHTTVLSCLTSSTGYFEKDLLQNTNFVVIIKSLGVRQVMRVPAKTEQNLFGLTATEVVGEDYGGDDGGGGGPAGQHRADRRAGPTGHRARPGPRGGSLPGDHNHAGDRPPPDRGCSRRLLRCRYGGPARVHAGND